MANEIIGLINKTTGVGVADADARYPSKGAIGAITSSGLTTSTTDVLIGRATAGGGAVEEIACTAAGRALLDDLDAAAQRTTMGAEASSNKVTSLSGSSTDAQYPSAKLTYDQLTLKADIAGTIKNVVSKTHAQMVAMKTGGTFAPGQWYEISDFQLKWRVPGDPTQIDSGSVEPLLVFAISNSELFKIAYSKAYPEDEIIYELEDYASNPNPADTTTQTRTGYISRRIDRMRDIDIGWDFRSIKWRAYKLDLSSVPAWSSATTYGKFTQAGTLAGTYAIYNNKIYYSKIANNISGTFNSANWTLACSYDLSATYFTGNVLTMGGRLTLNPDKSSYIPQPTFTNSLTSAGTDQSTNVYNMKIANGYGNVFYSTSTSDSPHDNYIYSDFIYNTFSYNFYNNMIGNTCYNNVAGYNFHDNSFDGIFNNNNIGNACYNNIVGVNCNNNSFGSNFQHNYFGVSCYGNTIGNDFHLNSNNNNFYSNTIGDQFHHNTTGSFYINVVGDTCVGNEIGGSCYYNVIGNNMYSNTLGLNFASNTIGNSFQYNDAKTGITADFSSASHVYATYNCQLFKNYSGADRLSYYNASDSLVITDITN